MNKESLDSDLWVDRYGDLLYRYTLVRVNDPDAAQEIVQVTLLAALEANKSFEGRSSEKSWLFGILKHKILDHYRRLKKYKTFDLLPEDDTDPFDYQPDGHWKSLPIDWKLDPEKAAENTQLVRALAGCMDKLPEKFRRIFVLKEIEGLSSDKICNEFNVKPTNLWVILHRARNQLKKCLEIHWVNKV
ncbi:MAG TPA: sigma-70 family RNA polymerase sigma factor [Nitrospinaceae bacterium]|jgi:RNA polymerase sigma-70 factor (ECF subfamily)|nr:RNA polymerase subunit sigma-70 [Nitrospinota bacterium]MDP6334687.1 sigma-70 family RNA polymerase sigma factor [Nitrospinaceae bacterium]HAX47296.1 RNA polymerase subunit sigma-70 [Nitrospina sp.]MDP7147433.1 sigma-70 family RNA polymerase sigma factor [Nitrospinaceae bacterium]MEE1550770.1 sigma-70 family RNA polymerase sigma factor [Nitrospinaceae bacterium]|tara:strand:+ start:4091 stop:4654 length:564 start_codon:yes stop_codon:yes gene_type:complete